MSDRPPFGVQYSEFQAEDLTDPRLTKLNQWFHDVTSQLLQHHSSIQNVANAAQPVSSGPSLKRPKAGTVTAGFQYYDTTLGKPVWWSGKQWLDVAGKPA